MVEDLPDVDVLIVPIGGGSGAAGACVVAAGRAPDLRVVGVQSTSPGRVPVLEGGPARRGPDGHHAEGLATRTAFELPQRILREHLDDFVLVDDDESGGRRC